MRDIVISTMVKMLDDKYEGKKLLYIASLEKIQPAFYKIFVACDTR